MIDPSRVVAALLLVGLVAVAAPPAQAGVGCVKSDADGRVYCVVGRDEHGTCVVTSHDGNGSETDFACVSLLA